jgi:hypothetical protein
MGHENADGRLRIIPSKSSHVAHSRRASADGRAQHNCRRIRSSYYAQV